MSERIEELIQKIIDENDKAQRRVSIGFLRAELSKLKGQAEVDALVATERALVVQKAAEHIYRSVYGKCACGWSVNPSKKASGDEQWQQHIISLADQNLLQEHDAALRQQWDNESFPNKWIEAKVKVRDEYIAKLEAENAGLRGFVDRQSKCIHGNHALLMGETFEDCRSPLCKEARTLLGEKP